MSLKIVLILEGIVLSILDILSPLSLHTCETLELQLTFLSLYQGYYYLLDCVHMD